jgi:hypothetical protein
MADQPFATKRGASNSEALIGLDLQKALLELGCAMVRLAHREGDIKALTGAKAIDFAILDVMLGM